MFGLSEVIAVTRGVTPLYMILIKGWDKKIKQLGIETLTVFIGGSVTYIVFHIDIYPRVLKK